MCWLYINKFRIFYIYGLCNTDGFHLKKKKFTTDQIKIYRNCKGLQNKPWRCGWPSTKTRSHGFSTILIMAEETCTEDEKNDPLNANIKCQLWSKNDNKKQWTVCNKEIETETSDSCDSPMNIHHWIVGNEVSAQQNAKFLDRKTFRTFFCFCIYLLFQKYMHKWNQH